MRGCSVTVEDVTSGRMLDIDRAVAKQLGMETFPPEAYAVGDKFVMNDTGQERYLWYQVVDENGNRNAFYDDYMNNPSHRPYRWMPIFNEIPILGLEDRTSLVTTQQWLNPSGKISYLHYVVNGDRTAMNDKWNKILFEQMHFEFPTFDSQGTKVFSEKLYDALRPTFYSDQTQKLLDEWMTTGEIPDQLQYKLLRGIVFDPRME